MTIHSSGNYATNEMLGVMIYRFSPLTFDPGSILIQILQINDMKSIQLLTRKGMGLLALVLSFSVAGHAAIFTASTSGDFTSSSTWAGGIVPPTTLVTDQIVIPVGMTVNMNTDITINGVLADLNVQGGLTSTSTSVLTLTLGTLSGSGTVLVNTMNVEAASAFAFTGTITANTINSTLGFISSADIYVNEMINLVAGDLTLVSGGSLDVATGGIIVIAGGGLNIGSGGSVGLTNSYKVWYIGNSAIAGIELTGSGLYDVTVDVISGSTVTLTTHLTIAGELALIEGRLILAGNNLTINGNVAAGGNGTVTTTVLSSIALNSPAGTLGTITFTDATAAVNNLTVNVGTGNEARINGFLTVNGTLQLNTGVLSFHNTDLTVNGSISGAGMLSGSAGSDLSVETINGSTTALNFAVGGQLVNNFNVAAGSGVSVTLGSDLTVNGNLSLTGGSNLDINNNHLTLNPLSSLTGTGSLIADADADLTINSTGGINTLRVVGSIGDFNMNTINGDVALGADLTVNGVFNLQSGTLVLSARDLTLNGNISATGTGVISSTATSDIAVSSAVTPDGALRFLPSAQTVGNLTVSMFNLGLLNIGTDLHIAGTLEFVSGKLGIMGNMLTIDPSGSITGHGPGSYVVTSAGGRLERSMTAGASTATDFPVGTLANYAPARMSLATGSTSGRVEVGVVSGVKAQGVSGVNMAIDQPLVNATWDINSSVTSNLDLNLQLMWSAGMEVNSFDRTAVYITHHTGGAWDTFTLENSTTEPDGMFSIQRDGITSLSPFAIFNESTTTSIGEATAAIVFGIHPNPTTDNLIVTNNEVATEPVNVQIYNAAGQVMGTYRLTDVITTIAVNGLTPGNYLIRFYNSTMSSSQRFIKM